MTPMEIARAWWSVKDEWIVRRNKTQRKQWEVVHNWGGDLISDDTMKVVGRYQTQSGAEKQAERLEDAARGAAVLGSVGGPST